MAREFLSRTWNPVVFLNRAMYPFGNTLMEDLLENLVCSETMDLLLLGCGDIRHLLKTVSSLSCRPGDYPPPRLLRFCMNDIDPVIIARDICLLEIICGLDPSDQGDIAFLWSVWYNLELSTEHHQRLVALLRKLICKHDVPNGESKVDQHGKFVLEFFDADTRKYCLELWNLWLETTYDQQAVTESRNKRTNQYLSHQLGMSGPDWTSGVSSHQIEPEIIDALVSRLTSRLNLPRTYKEEFRRWTVTGSAQVKNIKGGIVNPTMLRPGDIDWTVHFTCNPFQCYLSPHSSLRPSERQRWKSPTNECLSILKMELGRIFDVTKNVKVEVCFHAGDCLSLCSHLLKESGKEFDVIDTSNLADSLGLNSLLLACRNVIKSPNGYLTTGSLGAVDSDRFASVDEYIAQNVGCHKNLLPTIYGLHLADNLELGASTRQLTDQNCLRGLFTLQWMKSKDITPGSLDLLESPEIREAIESILKSCFNHDNVRLSWIKDQCGLYLRTPLLALHLLMRLEPLVQGGVQMLLKTFCSVLPSKCESMMLKDMFCVTWRSLLAAIYGWSDPGKSQHNENILVLEIPAEGDFPKKEHPMSSGYASFGQVILQERYKLSVIMKKMRPTPCQTRIPEQEIDKTAHLSPITTSNQDVT